MNVTFNIEDRKSIWIALSEFYLDRELEESDFRDIAFKIIESPYSFAEVVKINKYELFPILQPNLLSVSGEWIGFNEKILVKTITESLSKRNLLKKIGLEISYLTLKWMCRGYWKKLKIEYNKIETDYSFHKINNSKNLTKTSK